MRDPGAWKDHALLTRIAPASLVARDGCTVILRTQTDGSFKGGTEGKVCRSNLRGAGYATTEITISDRQTVTWERGYNAGNRRVWGSARGGFIFNRQ